MDGDHDDSEDSRQKWDNDRNDKNRMSNALKYLESFEVENELEATTVARLCERLTENLRLFHNRAKEDSLFPTRVSRAKDVAMSIMKNAEKQRTELQNLTQMNLKVKPPTLIQDPIVLAETSTLKNKLGSDPRPTVSKAPPYKEATHRPSVPQMNRNPQTSENARSDDSIVTEEDTKFLKKLMALLEALPQNTSRAEGSMNSKLLMLKSLLLDKKSEEQEQANQKLLKQVASMVQDTISAQNASLNQQLMMLMSSQNSTPMVMQAASLRGNPMQLNDNSVMSGAGLVPVVQSAGNIQTNLNSFVPLNQNLRSQAYGQVEQTAPRPIDQNTYQAPRVEMPVYPSTSQNYDDFGYDNSMERNYLPKGDPYIGQQDVGMRPRQNEPRFASDMGFKPNVYDKEWDNPSYGNSSEPRYTDPMGKPAPYTRVSLSPTAPRNRYDDYNDNARGEIGIEDMRYQRTLRAYSSSDWDDQEGDIYSKRARLDTDNRSESYNDQSLEDLGINTADMPEELLNRIKGKDLFTASAIISEYTERYSGK